MLLFFWKQLTLVGDIAHLRWYHDPTYFPVVTCAGSLGISVVNPFLHLQDTEPICSYVQDYQPHTCTGYFNQYIQIGTSAGLKKIWWDSIKDVGCSDIPVDIESLVENSYTVASGLLSNDITKFYSTTNYLAVITPAGLSWTDTTENFINYSTTSGSDVFICDAGPVTYFAEGSDLKIKMGIPADFNSWDAVYSFDREIKNVQVNPVNGTIFLATVSGVITIKGNNVEIFDTVISGSSLINQINIEYDSDQDWGHLFTVSSGMINVLNLKSKHIDKYVEYDAKNFCAIIYPRFYSW